MNTLAIVKSGYQTIPLSLLDESSTNPRRTFEPSKLNELADSIRNLCLNLGEAPFPIEDAIPSLPRSTCADLSPSPLCCEGG